MKNYIFNPATMTATVDGQEVDVIKGWKQGTVAINLKSLNGCQRKWAVIKENELEGIFEENYTQKYIDKLNKVLTLDNIREYISDKELFDELIKEATENHKQALEDKEKLDAEAKRIAKEKLKLEKARLRLAELEKREKEREDVNNKVNEQVKNILGK